MNTKICTKCKRELPMDMIHFTRDKTTKDGFYIWCKECKGTKFKKTTERHINRMGYRFCCDCKKEYPLNADYFGKNKSNKSGFSHRCKECTRIKSRVQKNQNPNYYKKYNKDYYEKNKEVLLENEKQYYIKNKESINERNRKYGKIYYKENIEKMVKYREKWKNEINPDYFKNRYIKDKNKISEYNKERRLHINELRRIRYGKLTKEEKRKLYLKKMGNPDFKQRMLLYSQKRRTLKKKNIATLTQKDWKECLKFFGYKDAYTGLPMETVSQDHVIPLSKGGGYTKQNIIPCEKDINARKQNFDMETWYRKQDFFSEERLEKIYKWTGIKGNIQQLRII